MKPEKRGLKCGEGASFKKVGSRGTRKKGKKMGFKNSVQERDIPLKEGGRVAKKRVVKNQKKKESGAALKEGFYLRGKRGKKGRSGCARKKNVET